MAHSRIASGWFSTRHEPIRNAMSSLKVDCKPGRGRLRLGVSRSRRRFGGVVCFAAIDGDDVREKLPDVGTSSSGVGSVVEDRPGNTKTLLIILKIGN